MQTVGVKVLKSKLSEYLRLAQSGETVQVTDRKQVIAEIVPPRKPAESVIERGIREGWITPATDRSGMPPPRKPIPGYTLDQLLADLDKDREDRW
jgi:antitoxin (DNA-binding transcriptional repressor) of toxin-antitoxin stability system